VKETWLGKRVGRGDSGREKVERDTNGRKGTRTERRSEG
jgi:hypothetical protein